MKKTKNLVNSVQTPQVQKINQIKIGDIEIISSEMSLEECANVGLAILNQDNVKSYFDNLKLSKTLKDAQTYYG